MNLKENLMDKVISLCKRRGFIFPGSEIYGGLAGTWDYGPVGCLLKKNIKDIWWKDMVQLKDDIIGIDAAIMMNPKAWKASGHIDFFSDSLVECKICHERFRADKTEDIKNHEKKHHDKKAEWTEPKNFNLLVKAYLGVIEGEQSEIFLRGEITNGVQVNFKNVLQSTRVKIPFGIAQIGKAFRNEITPGNFLFRSREFEQMEVQFYIKPDKKEGEKWFNYWKQNRIDWYLKIGIKKENLRFRDHTKNELAHYAHAATDIEYNSPMGWVELMGIHNRGDWDLKRHQEFSGQNMEYIDEDGNHYLPWDIETSAGVDRTFLFLLIDAYTEENNRIYLKLNPKIAPYKIAIFPLLANKPCLIELARKIYNDLKNDFMVAWDDRGNIGKRYYAQDEIGTPWCITVDFESLEKNDVTVRDRDTMKQERIKIEELRDYFSQKLQ